MRLYVKNKSYFIVDQCQKDMCFYAEDGYYHYDIDVDRILLHKSNKEYFIRYRHSNEMGIEPLQSKIKNFYYEIHNDDDNDDDDDDDDDDEVIYIENSDKEFFEKNRKIWNKITELMFIYNTPDFVKYTLDDEEYIEASVLRNTNFVKSNCHKDETIIVLHSVVNNNLKSSLLKVMKYEY